ncbi:GDSL esterase/lipase 2, partial [Stylosanthes scabra]|nr:GDSL esterase/lipase 2 [Stylosanthes scabra]
MDGLMLLLVLCLSSSILIQASEAQICLPKKHVALFVFGDSLFDIGNKNFINTTPPYQANYPPYGLQTLFKYPSGRFSDGRMIPDVVAELAGLPLHPGNPDFSYGVNFASAGA